MRSTSFSVRLRYSIRSATVTSFRPWRSQNSEVGHAGHRPVVLHDLADDAGRREAREPREVDGGLRLPRALEHAACAGAGGNVPGMDEVVRRRGRVDGDLDRPRAVGSRDARRDAVAGLDGDGERGAELRLVLVGHLAQPELVAALGVRQRHTSPRPWIAMKLTASASRTAPRW